MDAPSAVAPQWFTLEFGAYYVLIALFFVRVVPDGMTATVEACRADMRCRRRLSPGWLGPSIDLSDHQWRAFRGSRNFAATWPMPDAGCLLTSIGRAHEKRGRTWMCKYESG